MSDKQKTCPGHAVCPFCQKKSRDWCCADAIKLGAWDVIDGKWYHDGDCQGVP